MIINNFDDILQAMEQDPALREAMRRHILTEELLQLPVQVSRLETSVAQLQEGQSRLETSVAHLQEGQSRLETRMDGLEAGQDVLKIGQEELRGRMDHLEAGQKSLELGQDVLKGRMDSMAGRLGDAVGHAYEARAAELTPRRLRQQMGIRNATLIMAATQPTRYGIHDILDEAVEINRISEAEAEDLENLDLAFAGQDPSGNTIQAAIEASITISTEDIRRAIRRAEILEPSHHGSLQARGHRRKHLSGGTGRGRESRGRLPAHAGSPGITPGQILRTRAVPGRQGATAPAARPVSDREDRQTPRLGPSILARQLLKFPGRGQGECSPPPPSHPSDLHRGLDPASCGKPRRRSPGTFIGPATAGSYTT